MKRQMRPVHDCSCRYRCLAAAFFTLVQFPRGKVVIFGGAATGTLPAVRPNDFKESPAAGVIIGVTAFEVGKGGVKGGIIDHQSPFFPYFFI
jgi:hypothetical protein